MLTVIATFFLNENGSLNIGGKRFTRVAHVIYVKHLHLNIFILKPGRTNIGVFHNLCQICFQNSVQIKPASGSEPRLIVAEALKTAYIAL